MKIAIILGTRPEIIKMSPVIREIIKRKIDYLVIHTNQHYSKEMDQIFFEELNLPAPNFNLHVGSNTQGKQTADAISKIEEVLIKEKPDIVLVEGDTNTVLAGALAASKISIKIGHIEAGLRSYDRTMPEEINRVITDHISDFLFVPTNLPKEILIKENISLDKIYLTGNTIVDAVLQNIEIAKANTNILNKLNLISKEYILVTCHRAENVDNKEKLEEIIKGICLVSQELKLPIVFPIHPRTVKRLNEFEIKIPDIIKTIEPVGFLEFLQLEKNAKLILTDSGGVQEEACILQVPCVTLRENTERPETIDVHSNIIVGTKPEKILKGAKEMFDKNSWENPFGDGKAAEKIINILLKTDK
jgi:UDP-N-acetylglucosamine 2-epimerase (non-hydrolysing)